VLKYAMNKKEVLAVLSLAAGNPTTRILEKVERVMSQNSLLQLQRFVWILFWCFLSAEGRPWRTKPGASHARRNCEQSHELLICCKDYAIVEQNAGSLCACKPSEMGRPFLEMKNKGDVTTESKPPSQGAFSKFV
jgi:hypothetical protein